MNFNWENIDMAMVQGLVISYGVKIVSALLVFFVGRWIAKRIVKLMTAVMEKRKVDITLIRFLDAIIYYALLIMVIIAAAGQLGVETTSFVAIFGAASLAVGLALKDSLSNFASSVMLILFRPYKVGDFVEIAGNSGVVEAINVFNTVLNTVDNQRKIIPNGTIITGTITNVTANPTRRIDLVIGVSYEDDIRKVKESLDTIIARQPLLLKDPAPVVAVVELADSSVNFAVRPWVNTADYWTAYFALLEDIKLSFDQQGITFPFPQQDVHLFTQDVSDK